MCREQRSRRAMWKELFCLVAFAAILYAPSTGLAGPSYLGSAQDFAVLGYAGVTNAHPGTDPSTQVYGYLGVTPSLSVTGFYPDGTVSGGATNIHINDAVAIAALADATTAKTNLGLLGPGTLLAADLVGLTLAPGVYTVPAGTTNLVGTLTLDGTGNADELWVFQMSSTLITSPGSVVNVINAGSGAGVYWQVGSSATLDIDTTFAGNILALASVSLNPRAEILCGRAFARTGSVTLIDNLISNNNTVENFNHSSRLDFGSYGFSGGSATPIPEPSTILLLGLGGIATAFIRGRRKA